MMGIQPFLTVLRNLFLSNGKQRKGVVHRTTQASRNGEILERPIARVVGCPFLPLS
jgi:hypothetical protein